MQVEHYTWKWTNLACYMYMLSYFSSCPWIPYCVCWSDLTSFSAKIVLINVQFALRNSALSLIIAWHWSCRILNVYSYDSEVALYWSCMMLKLHYIEAARYWSFMMLKLRWNEVAWYCSCTELKFHYIEVARYWNCTTLKLSYTENVLYLTCTILKLH